MHSSSSHPFEMDNGVSAVESEMIRARAQTQDAFEREEFTARFRASFLDPRCERDQTIARLEERAWQGYSARSINGSLLQIGHGNRTAVSRPPS